MDIAQENLAGKVVLEVGSGRGGTTRKLADLLSGQPGTVLIATDISDRHFQQLLPYLVGLTRYGRFC